MGQIKAKTMIEKMGFVDKEKGTPEHDKIQEWTYNNAMQIRDELFSPLAKYKLLGNEWEHRLMSGNFVAGFVDILLTLQDKAFQETILYESDKEHTCFEIKVNIPSIGELIRQVRFYQAYMSKTTRFVIVSPVDKYKELLLGQGIYFYKYQDPEKLF